VSAPTTTPANGKARRAARKAAAATPAPTSPAPAPDATTPAPATGPAPCRCGCGTPTVRPEARYVAGHDARHAAAVGRSDLPVAEFATVLGTDRLVAKATAIRATELRRQAEKAARRRWPLAGGPPCPRRSRGPRPSQPPGSRPAGSAPVAQAPGVGPVSLDHRNPNQEDTVPTTTTRPATPLPGATAQRQSNANLARAWGSR
jgi:hypothetical protein